MTEPKVWVIKRKPIDGKCACAQLYCIVASKEVAEQKLKRYEASESAKYKNYKFSMQPWGVL